MLTRIPVYVFDDKYPTETDGFTFDLTAFIGDTDAIVTLPTVTITPDGATIQSVVMADGFVTVWIGDGTPGVTYSLEMHVVTQQNRDVRVRASFAVEA